MKMLFLLSILMLSMFFLCEHLGLRINVTSSLPLGLYRKLNSQPERGDLVTFCLSEDLATLYANYLKPGSCHSGVRPLLKILEGLPNDELVINHDGLQLNGETLSATAQRQSVPTLLRSGTIPQDMALAVSHKENSFDSRYFGLIPLQNMLKVIPIWTFE